jgi:hypothetical protein
MALYQLHDLAGNINIKAESLTVLGVPITPGGVGFFIFDPRSRRPAWFFLF